MKTIGVIFGGRSVEHDISIITGQFIIAALGAAPGFVPVPIYIARSGRWYSAESLADVATFRRHDFTQHLESLRRPVIRTDGEFSLGFPGLFGAHATRRLDVAFPVLHGTNGEDGMLAGILSGAVIPFVGCDIAASAIAMDKALAKIVTERVGIPSTPYVFFTKREWNAERPRIEKEISVLHSPLFVKPVHLGSSIGVTRVESQGGLEQAVEVALHYDDKVIVEQGVPNLIEVNCAVLGNEEVRTSVLEQPLAKAALLSFDDKYMRGGKGSKGGSGSMSGAKESVRIPAPVDEKIAATIREFSVRAFRAIGGSGTARFDFLIDQKSGSVYLNEINPLPGSLQQHLWKASGVSNVELVTKLIALAEERFADKQKRVTTFASSVLQRGS
ncbi:MAG: D-alanine--D-alanine ligase family protein [bacterium]|nr:D-alanine--D-alanine ligase family protein [bacterium]MDZ4285012.1 D-alanine--D-alanine ligase family protein [Patescibacteria group bacterium]